MALVFNDRVKETSATTGTGTLNLGGAFQDFQTFVAGIGNSNETYYNIVLPQTGEFEVGRGVVTDASPDTLSRLEVFTSSNSGNLVDFSAGTKTVFCTLPANKFVPGKFEGTNFTNSILIGNTTTGTLSSAQNNVGVGIGALDAITSGDNNTAVGREAGTALIAGTRNTMIGSGAGDSITDGAHNTVIGSLAGSSIANAGHFNTLIGKSAGSNISTGDGNVVIGAVDADSATGDRQLKISGYDGSTTTTWISGDNTGALTFADKVILGANKVIEFGDSGETISGDGTDMTVASSGVLNLNSAAATGPAIKLQSSAGGVLVDSASLIVLDADNADNGIQYKDGATEMLRIHNSSSDVILHTKVQDKDLIFKGNDGGSDITPMMIDMSEGGRVGIGTTTPAAPLHINDSGGAFVRLTRTGFSGYLQLSTAGGAGSITVDGNNTFNIRTNGNIGLSVDGSGNTAIGQGTLTANQGVIVDNITIDGNEIDLSSGDFTLDVQGNINLDADAGSIFVRDSGTVIVKMGNDGSQNAQFKSNVSDKDILFKGNDGPSEITALTLDMSEAGAATFNDKIILGANKSIEFGDAGETISGDGTNLTIASSQNLVLDTANELKLDSIAGINLLDNGSSYGLLSDSSGDFVIKSQQSDKDIIIKGNDGGSTVNALTFDMSEGGDATFNAKIILPANESLELGDAGETIFGDGSGINILSSGRIDTVSNDTGTQSTLITSAGGLYIDSAETNRIDAGTGITNFYKAGTLGISLNIDGNNDTVLHSRHNDKDIKFDGQDNNSTITALTLDMSEAGAATFNDKIILNANKVIEFGDSGETISGDGTNLTVTSSGFFLLDVTGNILLDSANNGFIALRDNGTSYINLSENAGNAILNTPINDGDFLIKGNDGGSEITALTLDMSEGGAATFNDDIIIKDNGTIGTTSTPAQMTLDSGGKVTFVNHVAINSDLFLQHDEAQIQLGGGQDIRIIHDHNDGLVFKNTSTGDDKPFILTLQTGETDIAANDVLGKIDFQAPDEGTGTDAILVAAGIEAVSEGDFSSSSNATKLSFKTAVSEAASEKMSLSSAGNLTVTGTVTANGETLSAGVSAGFAVAMAIAL